MLYKLSISGQVVDTFVRGSHCLYLCHRNSGIQPGDRYILRHRQGRIRTSSGYARQWTTVDNGRAVHDAHQNTVNRVNC